MQRTEMPFARVFIALFLGFGVGTVLFMPSSRYTQGPVVAMVATPSAQSTHFAKAWPSMQVRNTYQKQFLSPRLTQESVANANLVRGRRGELIPKALPVAELAEAGKIFDFNATLPAQIFQFLALMFFLDKSWFGPVGKLLDERDEKIRGKLASVGSNTDEVEKLRKEAEQLVADARSEVKSKLEAAAKQQDEKAQKTINEEKAKIEREMASVMAEIESERMSKEEMQKQAKAISDMVVKKIIPAEVGA